MFNHFVYLLIVICFFNFQIENYTFYDPEYLLKDDEISLTVLSQACDHLAGRPIALKVRIDGGTPDYTLYAGGLVIGQEAVNEFVILGLNIGEGVDVTVTDALGNSAEFWAEAIIMPSPGANAGIDQVISCVSGLAVLDGTSGYDNVAFSWSGPDTDFDHTSSTPGVDVSGLYYLTVISMDNGCRSYDSTYVYDAEYPEFDYELSPLNCHGDASGSISFILVKDGTPPYSYSIDGGTSYQAAPDFDELAAGWFELVLRDQLACTDDTLVQLTEPDAMSLDVGPSVSIPYGQGHQIRVESNLTEEEINSILWTPQDGLSCADCMEPIANPKNNTTYELSLEDVNGCIVRAYISIAVEKDTDIYIPNVFTPNGDNINDMFFIEGANGVLKVKSLQIYNRWGNKVFEANDTPLNDPAYGWDGKYKGGVLASGVFVYVAIMELVDGIEVIYSGDLTLIN